MSTTLALNMLAALSIQVSGGTHVVVPAGNQLEVNTSRGSIQIESWDRNEVEVSGQHSEAIRLEVKAGSTVEVQETRPPRTALERTEIVIRIPATMAVSVISDDSQVVIRGIRAGVNVNINHGEVEVHDVEGTMFLDTTTGSLSIENSVGDALLDATSGSITIHDFEGSLVAETVGGIVELSDMRTRMLRVTTNSGDIHYEGSVEAGAVFDLASQTGQIELSLPATMSAEFEVGTVRGAFSSAFDLGGIEPVQGETFVFSVRSGAAKVSVITYSGDIHIGVTAH